jgi:predicted amidohydrolase YtcJ
MTAPDEVITGGDIHTLDPSDPSAQALALQHGRVLAAGRDDDILRLAGARTIITHLQGRTVLPGLIDAHLHLQHLALALARLDCEVPSLADCLAGVAERAGVTPAGEWILGHGWNHNTWGAFPDRYALDVAAPHHPVYLTAKSLHLGWANSQALARAGLDRASPDPIDGQIQRDAQGNLTGILFEGATNLITSALPAPSLEDVVRALASAQASLWRLGLTGVHDFDGPMCFAALQTLRERGELGLRVLKSIPLDQLDAALELGLRSGFGDDWIRLGAVKVFADGALGPRTAAMLDDYAGDPGNRGSLFQDRESLFEIGRRALPAGLALAVHAIGDRANHEVLLAFSALARQAYPGAPHMPSRVEHVQLLHPDDVPGLARHNLVASMQPIHATSDMVMAQRHWGDRVRTSYAWRSLARVGTRLVFGSDAPVESPNPFWGLHAAVTRRRQDGSPGVDGWLPQERLERQEALLAFTRYPGELAGMAGRQGILRAGSLADLIVLDGDPLACAEDELYELRPCGTMVAGRWRYRDF